MSTSEQVRRTDDTIVPAVEVEAIKREQRIIVQGEADYRRSLGMDEQ